MLSKHGKSPALMELVVPRLREHINISAYSDEKKPLCRLIDMILALWRYRKQCTLVIIDTFSTTAFWYCYILAMLCRIFRIPYMPVLHGGLFEKRLQSTPRFSRHIFANSAANISPSLFLKRVFEEHNFIVTYLPNFIELENYPFYQRTSIAPTLLWVRAFHKIYNPFMAIEVLRLLHEKFPNASLTMVGADKDGSLEYAKQMSKDLGLEDRIIFKGYLSKPEWIALSAHHDFFLNTTTADNMPVSVMEGMALGLIVISTRVGGIPYLLEDAVDSYLVESNNSNAMADRILYVINNPLVGQHLTLSARQKSETFSWLIVRDQWLSIIKRFQKES